MTDFQIAMRTDYIGLRWQRRDLIAQVIILSSIAGILFSAAAIWMCLDHQLRFFFYEVSLLCLGAFISGIWITSAIELLRVNKKLSQLK
jgi:hypothetical protein